MDDDLTRPWLLSTLARLAPDFPGPITGETPLVESGLGLDSLLLADLATEIEHHLRVLVPPEALAMENFATVDHLMGYLIRAPHGRAAAPGSA